MKLEFAYVLEQLEQERKSAQSFVLTRKRLSSVRGCTHDKRSVDAKTISFEPIRLNGRPLSIHKAIVAPEFKSKTALVTDTWEYVTMWLKRHQQKDAGFYWEQASHFFDASRNLPNTSSPLTLYYCFLNAVKALLLKIRIKKSRRR